MEPLITNHRNLFHEIYLSPVVDEMSIPLLTVCNPEQQSLHRADKRTLYMSCVKSMNTLNGDNGPSPQ